MKLGGLAPESGRLDADSARDVLHQPFKHGQVVKSAGHHGGDVPWDDLAQPERVEPGGMIGNDQNRTVLWEALQARPVSVNPVGRPDDDLHHCLDAVPVKEPPRDNGAARGQDSQEPELGHAAAQNLETGQQIDQE